MDKQALLELKAQVFDIMVQQESLQKQFNLLEQKKQETVKQLNVAAVNNAE